MKKLLQSLLLIIITTNVFCQVPQLMSYQAVIRNNAGNLISNVTVGTKISILQGTPTGTPVFVETQNPTTNTNGLVTIQIGNGTLISGSLSGIDWSNGTYYIKTETDPLGGTDYTITGTSQLISVPYAFYAGASNNHTSSTSGVFSRPFNNESNIQLIPHGLGAVPSKVKITAKGMPDDPNGIYVVSSDSVGIFETNANTTSTIWSINFIGSSENYNSTSDIVSIYYFIGEGQTATISVDNTNIILTWTYHDASTSLNTSPIQILWEATK
jgi:hypothetical protein